MMGSLDHVTRRLIVHTSRTKRSADFIAHLEQLDRLFGPKPGRVTRPVVAFTDAKALDREIHMAVEALNNERNVDRWLTGESLLRSRARPHLRFS